MSIASDRPLRADAERNRQRLLDAARELFRTRGLEVTMDDIAAHAGVGVGTAYRRFRSRDELIDALFEARMAESVRLLEACGAAADPWQGIVDFLERALEMQAEDRGLKQLFHSRKRDREMTAVHDRLYAVLSDLVARAHAAGSLRRDVTIMDLSVVSLMAGGVADVTEGHAPGAWRRALHLALDGLRTGTDRTDPVPGPALTREQFEAALECWRPPANHHAR